MASRPCRVAVGQTAFSPASQLLCLWAGRAEAQLRWCGSLLKTPMIINRLTSHSFVQFFLQSMMKIWTASSSLSFTFGINVAHSPLRLQRYLFALKVDNITTSSSKSRRSLWRLPDTQQRFIHLRLLDLSTLVQLRNITLIYSLTCRHVL